MIKVGELREQITQNAKRTKNKMALQELITISDLFRKRYDEENYKLSSEAEWQQILLIDTVLRIQDLKYLRSLKAFAENFTK